MSNTSRQISVRRAARRYQAVYAHVYAHTTHTHTHVRTPAHLYTHAINTPITSLSTCLYTGLQEDAGLQILVVWLRVVAGSQSLLGEELDDRVAEAVE